MSASYDGADRLNWRKAQRSINNGNCVEIGTASGAVLVRDSKDRHGAVLHYSNDSWLQFIHEARMGRFDRLRLSGDRAVRSIYF